LEKAGLFTVESLLAIAPANLSLLKSTMSVMRTKSARTSMEMAWETLGGRLCFGKKTNVMSKSPIRSNILSMMTVVMPYVRETPVLFDRT